MRVQNEKSAKRRVTELVSNAKVGINAPIQYTGVHNPVAEKFNIRIVEEKLPFDEGQYVPSFPPLICIDPEVADPDRLNFTFFHEVTHYLIVQDDDLLEFLGEYTNKDYERMLELLCNIGAAEFLAPLSELHSIIQEQGFQVSLIETLDQRFPASKPALVTRLAEAAPHKCIMVICAYGVPLCKEKVSPGFVNASSTHPRLYVQHVAISPACIYPCGRYATISPDHIIWAAYQDKCNLSGQGNIPFLSGTVWSVDCEAHYYLGKVYAAFHIDPPPSKYQASFGFF